MRTDAEPGGRPHPDMRAAMERYHALVAEELGRPVDPRVTALAAAIAAEYPDAALALLFYGSCLRAADGEDMLDGQMLDFYLIVSEYRAAYGKGWLAFANRVLPPNVFPFAHDGLAAKYAVLSAADFAAMAGPQARDPSVMARFAQPARLVWQRDALAAAAVVGAVARAAPTLLSLAAPMVAEAERSDPLAIWRTAFALTYATELRAERTDRSGSIVDADPERYRHFGTALAAVSPEFWSPPPADPRARARTTWARFRRRGKRLTLLRLAKASTTFAGGIDYLAWKINRHAGAGIVIRPWQRRFPIVGALTLLPRLLRRGAVR